MSARSCRPAGIGRGAQGLLLLLAFAVISCGAPPPETEPAALVDTVEIGVAFDTPVVVVDGSEQPAATTSAWVTLAPDAGDDGFRGELAVVDDEGQPATVEVHLEVTVGESQEPL